MNDDLHKYYDYEVNDGKKPKKKKEKSEIDLERLDHILLGIVVSLIVFGSVGVLIFEEYLHMRIPTDICAGMVVLAMLGVLINVFRMFFKSL